MSEEPAQGQGSKQQTEARKELKDVADLLGDYMTVAMRELGYTFFAVYCPQDRPEDFTFKSNPDSSDPRLSEFLARMGSRFALLSRSDWHRN
jgi:hypothetical protein